LLEEYYWRWFVWEQLARRWSSWRAIVIANVGFTLHHIVVLYVYIPAPHFWTDGVLFSAAVLVGGIVWSVLYRYTNSIYSAWVSHAITDGALMFLGYDLCRSYWP
jgi:membrane protease YdiL (CAAX protease family)